MPQPDTEQPDLWAGRFLEYRERLLALARRNLNPFLARRVSPEDVVQDTLSAACGKIDFFENKPEIPVYFKLRLLLFQTVAALERRHLQCRKRDACKEVEVTEDGDCSAARLNWNRFADTVTGPLTRLDRLDRYALLRRRLARCRKTTGRFSNCVTSTGCPIRSAPKFCTLIRRPPASAMCGRCSGFRNS